MNCVPQGVYVRSRFLDAKISSSLLLNSVLEYTTQLFWINMFCENKHNFCFYVLCNPLCEEVALCSIGVIQLRWWFQQTYIYLSNQTFLYFKPRIYFNLCFAFFDFSHRNFGLVTKTQGKLMEYKLFSYVSKSFESGTMMFIFCWCFFLRVSDEKIENATFLKHFRADIFEDANFPYSLAADVNGCVRNRDDVTLS